MKIGIGRLSWLSKSWVATPKTLAEARLRGKSPKPNQRLRKMVLQETQAHQPRGTPHGLGILCAALVGTSVSEARAKLFRDTGILMLDEDEAGEKAMLTILRVLSRHFYVRVVALPEAEKPDAVLLRLLEQFF